MSLSRFVQNHHRRGGLLAKAAGDSFESWIAAQLETARLAGEVAWWRHVSPKVRWIGKGKNTQAKIVGAACADYVLQLSGGRTGVIEAKSFAEPRRLAICDISEEQRTHLNACAHGGGLALLLVEARTMVGGAVSIARFAVPWAEVPWRTRRTAQTVDAHDLAGWEAKTPLFVRRFVEGPAT